MLANLLLMSCSCREACRIPTRQLVVFLPYKERTKKKGQNAIQITHAHSR